MTLKGQRRSRLHVFPCRRGLGIAEACEWKGVHLEHKVYGSVS